MHKSIFGLIFFALSISGCATYYTTPAAGVSLAEIDDQDIRALYAALPAATFPANLAVVRVQDSGYFTKTSRGYGHGRFSIVTTRDIETDESFEKVGKMPLISGVAPIGRLLLPPSTNSIKDLRSPAAALHADFLLIYSVDSAFTVGGKSLGPLSMVSLGLIKNKTAHVTSTVAGILVDVRTGFVYGSTEATSIVERRASIWSTELAIDTSRMQAERKAFGSFIGEFQNLWTGVLNTHAITQSAAERSQPQKDTDSYFRVQFAH